jgi:CBS domain-containing protein/RNA polymerase-binding transcription factor DksA
MGMLVEHWMTPSPIRIGSEASAFAALRAMIEAGIRHLPVVGPSEELVGIASIDDLRAALPFPVSLRSYPAPGERQAAQELSVGELMTHAPRAVRPETPLQEAARAMAEWRIGCLPVVDESSRVVGMLTETDALRALVTLLGPRSGAKAARGEPPLGPLIRGLRAERWRLLEALRARAEAERELSAGERAQPMDDADRGTALQRVGLSEALADVTARRLASLERALDRAATGTLAVCESCRGDIPLARLRALPGATLCLRCAEKIEEGGLRETRGRAVPSDEGPTVPGGLVYTEAGEGRLLRISPFGTCGSCGEVEGRYDEEADEVVCSTRGCDTPLADVEELAVVEVGDETISVHPETLRPVPPRPYD